MINLFKKIINSIYNFIFCKKLKITSGEFSLFYGDDIVQIPVPGDIDIIELYIRIDDVGCQQVCSGNISSVGYRIVDGEIIFYTKIRSNLCKIKWFYTYKK